MIDFPILRERAISALCKIDTVTELTLQEIKKYGLKQGPVWEIKTEIENQNNISTDVILYLTLESDFPLSFPKFYLEKTCYDLFKYIPHVDSNKFICTYDSEVSRPDPTNPEGVLLECLRKAKRILEEGIKKLNTLDFEEEFLAYWNCSYLKEEKVLDILCFINPDSDKICPSLLYLSDPYGPYEYILHNSDCEAERAKSFLQKNGIGFKEYEVFYSGILKTDFAPPYFTNNTETLDVISAVSGDSVAEFEKFINQKQHINFVLGTIVANGRNLFIGWFYKTLNVSRNGFRKGSISPFYAFTTFQKTDKIRRAQPEIFTTERLMNRSKGILGKQYNFAVIGLGSIGSNLIHFLNTLAFPAFRFVDFENLKAENVGRHLLGLNYVAFNKASAVKHYLLSKNPLQDIQVKEVSIIEVINNEPDFINNSDFIFCITGKTSIDNWIVEALEFGIISQPIFFIWVEPYLAAGHCIYIPPGNKGYSSFFTSDDFFNFNVIASQYYKDTSNSIALKEGGCQTTYIPYSATDTLIFLGSAFKVITDIMEKRPENASAFTWIGDIDSLLKKTIELSDFGKDKIFGEIIFH